MAANRQRNAVVAICPFAPHILPKSHPGSMLPKGNQQGTLLSCGTAFLTPAPSNIDFSDSYTRRSPDNCTHVLFSPKSSVPDSVPGTWGAGKGLGWEEAARPVSGLPCLPGSRQKPELALHSGGWGRPLGSGQGHQPPTVLPCKRAPMKLLLQVLEGPLSGHSPCTAPAGSCLWSADQLH